MIDPMLAVTLLAEETNRGPDFGKASPVGLLIVVLLVIAGFFLVRSMNKQLRKVPKSFGAEPEAPAADTTAEAPAETPGETPGETQPGE